MIKTCFYTINYVLCKQRVAEDWIWRVWRTITGTITQTTARHQLQLNMRMPALLTPHLLSIVPLQLCVYSSGIISLQLKIVKPKSSPKNKSEIHVPNPGPKSKIQSPEERDWDWGWHYNPKPWPYFHPPHSLAGSICVASPARLWHDTYSARMRSPLIFAHFLYQNTGTMLYLNKIGERWVI